jgi:predicted DsbA family dithiol-disulfide isomerase
MRLRQGGRTIPELHAIGPSLATYTPVRLIFRAPGGRVNGIFFLGLSEMAIVGAALATANAIYHATGRRSRNLPFPVKYAQKPAGEKLTWNKFVKPGDPSRKARRMKVTNQQPNILEDAKGTADPTMNDFENRLKNTRMVLHWYDFLCPFCYVGQNRTAILIQHGLDVVELPFQVHPDIPSAGVPVGHRNGAMYSNLEREAKEAGLSLNWPRRLPDTRPALAAAEWVRRHQPDRFLQFHKDLFAAHFVLGEDLGNPAVIDRHATDLGIHVDGLHASLTDGTAFAAVRDAETIGHRYGVQGTPAWFIAHRLISGLLPAVEFERLAEAAVQLRR